MEAKDSVLNRMQKRGCGPRSGSGGSRRATGKKGSEDSQAAAAPRVAPRVFPSFLAAAKRVWGKKRFSPSVCAWFAPSTRVGDASRRSEKGSKKPTVWRDGSQRASSRVPFESRTRVFVWLFESRTFCEGLF